MIKSRRPLAWLPAAVLAAAGPFPRAAVAGTLDTTPPAVSIATPATLTGAVVATFSEAVRAVTPDNVVLRVSGEASNLPAGLSCRDAGGAAVSCATGEVRTATLAPGRPLVPGQAYAAIVNPPGALPVLDGGGNAAPTTPKGFRGSLVEEESSVASRYRWREVASSSAYGGSYATEHLAGGNAIFRFTGGTVAWYTVTGPSQGLASVYIDGVLRGTYNQYAPSTRFRVPRRFGGLSSGGHVLVIVVRGLKGSAAGTGTFVSVDAFEAGGVLHPSPAVTYRWRNVGAPSASGDRYATADIAGANVYFTFRGPGIDWYTMVGPNQGNADVYVDGVLKATIDNYAASTRYGVPRSLRNLSDRVHSLRIVVLGRKRPASTGRFLAVDRWVVRPASIAAFRRLGAWVDLYDYGLDPEAATAAMRSHGVRTLYLQTARYNSGADIVYPSAVDAWLEHAHRAGIKVVGWYLPAYDEWLSTDVRRTVAIARYITPAGHRFDALAVDIEYKGQTESLQEFNDGVAIHLSRVRRAVGTSYPVGAIVPAPLGMAIRPWAWEGFPWATIGRLANVVLPMGYWSYRTDCETNPQHCPYGYTKGNIAEARRLTGLPVHIIGGVGHSVTAGEVADFVRGAREARAYGGSLYDYRTTAETFWTPLAGLNLL